MAHRPHGEVDHVLALPPRVEHQQQELQPLQGRQVLRTAALAQLGERQRLDAAALRVGRFEANHYKGREAFVAMAAGFGKLVPDLRWEIKEVLVQGNRIVVRSEASGTPTGPFFGVPPSGKSFRIMAIDIHTIENGQAVTAYHVEDWASAIRQLSAK